MVTKEQIIAAFAVTGLHPARYIEINSTGFCGCALGALYFAEHMSELEDIRERKTYARSKNVFNGVAFMLGRATAMMIRNGFDGGKESQQELEAYNAARELIDARK